MASILDLGLSEYEASVYWTLLKTGPTIAKQVSRASGVPMGRIYDVLNDLEEAKLVRSQKAGQPTRYAPVEPRTALSRLLEARRRELQAELEQYEATVNELANQLTDADWSGESFWTVAIGPEDTEDLLCERLAAASDQLFIVAGYPSAQFDPGEMGDRVAGELEAALNRGIDVSVLVSSAVLNSVSAALLQKYGEVATDPAFELRVTNDVSATFDLVDRTDVYIEVTKPLIAGEAFALLALTDPSFAANLHEEFESQWSEAEPMPNPLG